MKIEMPKVGSSKGSIPDGAPFFAKNIESGLISSVLYSYYGVFYFSLTGTPISYSSPEFFTDNYEVVREYAPGETLSITM